MSFFGAFLELPGRSDIGLFEWLKVVVVGIFVLKSGCFENCNELVCDCVGELWSFAKLTKEFVCLKQVRDD